MLIGLSISYFFYNQFIPVSCLWEFFFYMICLAKCVFLIVVFKVCVDIYHLICCCIGPLVYPKCYISLFCMWTYFGCFVHICSPYFFFPLTISVIYRSITPLQCSSQIIKYKETAKITSYQWEHISFPFFLDSRVNMLILIFCSVSHHIQKPEWCFSLVIFIQLYGFIVAFFCPAEKKTST